MGLYRNRQWAVTRYGISSIKPASSYDIDAGRLTAITERDGKEYYDWPIHLAEKGWVDMPAFMDTFSAALQHHAGSYSPAVDPELLKATAMAVPRIARRSRE
jgi:hypothetical protein